MEETAIHPHIQPYREFGHIICASNLKLKLQTQHFGVVGSSPRCKSAMFSNTISNIAPFIHSDGQLFDNGTVVNIAPNLNQTGAHRNPLLDMIKQGNEAARNYHQLGASRGTLGFDTEGTAHTHANTRLVLSAERQARMNLTGREIRRLMPRDRKIRFNVDTRSFLDGNVSKEDIERVVHDAREVAEVFTREKLGITFLYTPDPGREVFSIRYSHALNEGDTLAHSFLPSDPPSARQMLVSSDAMSLAYGSGHSIYMQAIVAHEFTHILGFRHWHAGSDPLERREPSKLWPGTTDDDFNTIMCTPFHSSMDFTDYDFWVIRDVYSRRNGSVVEGCMIVDVDPHARRFIS